MIDEVKWSRAFSSTLGRMMSRYKQVKVKDDWSDGP